MNAMTMDAKGFFDRAQLVQINEAVKKAESTTSGEIVPVLASASGNYDRGLFFAALTGAIAGTLLAVAVHLMPLDAAEHEAWHIPLYTLLPLQLIGLAAGWRIAASSPEIWRRFVPRSLMKESVERAALNAFANLGITQTRDATGILIYVSLFERIAVVLGDRAIDSKLSKGTWQEVTDLVLKGFREKRPAEGYVAGILKCGELLTPHFPIKPDDTNELGNELRII